MAEDDAEQFQNDEEVSEYELLRRKNIEERNKFLESLGINDDINEIEVLHKPKKRQIVKSTYEDLPKREPSRRIRGLAIKKNKTKREPVPVPEIDVEVDVRLKGSVNLEMEDESFDFFNNLVGLKKDFSFDSNLDLSTCSLESFQKNLSCLQMKELRKVVPKRVQSICVHPTLSKQIVIAGCCSGPIGLWDLNSELEQDVMEFKFHQAPVNCITVSKFNEQKIFTTSHEGSFCCMDITQKKCTNVFSTDFSNRVKHLTWHDEMDANTFLIAHGDGSVGILDVRENCNQKISWMNCFDRSCRTVQFHPSNTNVFLASSGTVGCRIFDLRSKNDCLSDVTHPKGLTAAFFSPNGNHILTTCNDDYLRIFDSSSIQDVLPIKKKIPHNNHTGRWLSVFKAKWFPFRSDAFHIGCLLSPRRIQIYDMLKGCTIYGIRNEDMVTISPVLDAHPNRLFIAGGNSSGKVHAFIPPDSSKEAVL